MILRPKGFYDPIWTFERPISIISKVIGLNLKRLRTKTNLKKILKSKN